MAFKDRADPSQLDSRIQTEIDRIAPEVSKRLFAKPIGGKNLSEPDFLRYALEHWPDPEFRGYLLKAQGPKQFNAIADKLTKLTDQMIASGEPFPASWVPQAQSATPMQQGGPIPNG